MTIYPEQHQQMQATSNQLQASGLQNQLCSIPTTPEIMAFEQQLRILPSLPLNAEERNMIMRAMQQCVQRTSLQSNQR